MAKLFHHALSRPFVAIAPKHARPDWHRNILCLSSNPKSTNESTNAKTVISKTTFSSDSKIPPSKRIVEFMTRSRSGIQSISVFCGNTAFVLTTLAYLNTDMLALRIMSICSTTLMITFNYFRNPPNPPLWIPIRWNILLLSINGFMASSLLYERYKAESMGPEMEKLYEKGDFKKRGFNKVQFLKFFNEGRRVTVGKGEMITQEGKEISKFFYILDGTVDVTSAKDKRKLATMTPNNFIGEIAFLLYTMNLKDDDSRERRNIKTKASANVTACGGLVELWEWDTELLAHVMQEDQDLSNAFSAYCNHDLRAKLLSINELYAENFEKAKSRDIADGGANGGEKAKSSQSCS